MTPYTLRSDGDPLEKRCDALFIARDFPSYEVFWQKFVAPISRRPIDTGFLTDFQLARELKTAQDVCIAQLHYSVLLHLARAYDLMQLEIPGSTELLFGLTALGGAQDAAFELLERFQHRHKYAAWPRMKSGVLHDAGLDAERNWRQSHGHPLESLRSYSDMARAYRKLRERGVTHASTGPQRLPDWNPNAGGIEAFYFRDPDGHFLELIAFPAGKGDPKWRAAAGSGRLFLGLDHTAIVVADTETSLRLYRDALGLRVAGESENWGTEQEHLNNVFGARLRITGLRAAAGPGIEMLEYLAPRDGRPAPADLRASDLLHWQTTLATRDAARAAKRLRPPTAAWVSPEPGRQKPDSHHQYHAAAQTARRGEIFHYRKSHQ